MNIDGDSRADPMVLCQLNLNSSIISYTGIKLCGYERMYGDSMRDSSMKHIIKHQTEKLSNTNQLFLYAKNGIEKQNQENK